MTNGFDVFLTGLITGTVVAAGGGLAAYFLKDRFGPARGYRFDMSRFLERDRDHVKIYNTGSKPIESCRIFCDYEECKWSDHKTGPRTLTISETASVMLPPHKNANPVISLKSGEKTVRETKLMDITLAS
ncbi:hypothetical protein [Nitrososphaera sp.]|uniref:hypothetical protein n=1 Tax=Nitrososphaera sp. TaxID=1971748 RepID=UPI002ED8B611